MYRTAFRYNYYRMYITRVPQYSYIVRNLIKGLNTNTHCGGTHVQYHAKNKALLNNNTTVFPFSPTS